MFSGPLSNINILQPSKHEKLSVESERSRSVMKKFPSVIDEPMGVVNSGDTGCTRVRVARIRARERSRLAAVLLRIFSSRSRSHRLDRAAGVIGHLWETGGGWCERR